MNKIIDKIINLIGYDGIMHFLVSAIITLELRRFNIPRLFAALITLLIGVGKEIYDKVTKKGTASWKDIICDIAGVLFGLI